MAVVRFWDTSALAKRYFQEDGSAYVVALLDDEEALHVASRLTLAEVPSAIVRRVTAQDDADRLLAQFDRDIRLLFDLAEFDNALVDEAAVLVRRHRLRGCDSLQLASALRLAKAAEGDLLVFICADGDLNTAAAAEGLAVVDPNEEMSEK